MRVSFLVYGVLYVAVEIVGNQLEKVGWARIDPLDVASALTDALLDIVVCIAIVVAVDLGRARWGPALRAWNEERLRAAAEGKLATSWDEVTWDDEPIGVRSWRPEPLALRAPAPSSPGATYYRPSTYAPPFPEEPGPQT